MVRLSPSKRMAEKRFFPGVPEYPPIRGTLKGLISNLKIKECWGLKEENITGESM